MLNWFRKGCGDYNTSKIFLLQANLICNCTTKSLLKIPLEPSHDGENFIQATVEELEFVLKMPKILFLCAEMEAVDIYVCK